MNQIFRAVVVLCAVSLGGCDRSYPPEEPEPLEGEPGTDGGEGGGGGTELTPISFKADVMPIFKAKCTGCHGGQYDSASTAFERLKANTAGGACANTPRVIANDGANSLLVKKLLGTASCGSVMPLVKTGPNMVACTGEQCVSVMDIDKVKLWIDQGALDN
jgi:hypothetical protein